MSDPTTTVNQNRSKSTNSALAFPNDGSLDNQSTQISLIRYTRGNPRDPVSGEPQYNIHLPLPMSGLDDNINLQYQDVPLGLIGGMLTPTANKGNKLAASIVEGARFFATSTAGALGDLGGAAAGDVGLSRTADAIRATGDAAAAAIEQASGLATNPNLSLSFQGVELRRHNFSWRLIAKNSTESSIIQQILNALKVSALPQQVSGASLTLGYPSIAKISFTPKNLIKISDRGCFIESVSVKYDGEGYPAFFKTSNNPVVIDLSIIFRERAILTATDYGDAGLNTDIKAFTNTAQAMFKQAKQQLSAGT
jgi:hypothetical protein